MKIKQIKQACQQEQLFDSSSNKIQFYISPSPLNTLSCTLLGNCFIVFNMKC